MELIVLDTFLKMLSVLDTFESLIWTERYSAYGDFEVYTSINDSVLEILKDDYYLWLKESDQTITGIIAAIRLSPSPIWLSCRINLFTTHR